MRRSVLIDTLKLQKGAARERRPRPRDDYDGRECRREQQESSRAAAAGGSSHRGFERQGGKGARSERKRALEVRSAENTREESLCAVEPIPDEEEKRNVKACARPPSHFILFFSPPSCFLSRFLSPGIERNGELHASPTMAFRAPAAPKALASRSARCVVFMRAPAGARHTGPAFEAGSRFRCSGSIVLEVAVVAVALLCPRPCRPRPPFRLGLGLRPQRRRRPRRGPALLHLLREE